MSAPEPPFEFRVEPLSRSHDRAGFSCGVPALDTYLQRQARQDMERRLASVFVFTADGKQIAAFYTLSAQSISPEDLPIPLAAKFPRLPLPVTLLGRMAVDQTHKGHGVGMVVLLHALRQALQTAGEVASWAVIVDSKDGARDFYLKHGFTPLPSQPARLFIPMQDVAKLFLET